MKGTRLADEIHVDTGITAFATSHTEDIVAIGTKGMVGVYSVKEGEKGSRLKHMASYVVPGEREYAVTKISFNSNGDVIKIQTEDGLERQLSLRIRTSGMMRELSCTGQSGSQPASTISTIVSKAA